MRATPRFLITLLISLTAALVVAPNARAGDLEPPGPPGPTMKPLPELEPRIPIFQDHVPLNIVEPGSYYLVSNLEYGDTSGAAITISVDDVTLDLMGFSLHGPGKLSGGGDGIRFDGRSNVEIRNGLVRDFGGSGIVSLPIEEIPGKAHRILNVRSIANGGSGIYLEGSEALIRDCTASENGASGIGLSPGDGSVIAGNRIRGNGGYGIFASGSLIQNNVATNNWWSGIYASSSCTVAWNTLAQNNSEGSTGLGGITVAGSGNLVRNNTVTDSGYANILVQWESNVLEANSLLGSSYGIKISASGNFYAENRSTYASVEHFDAAAGNTDGGGNTAY